MGTSGTRLRVGLVGAGLVGQAAHAYFLWDERERFDLVALADPSAAVRAAVGDRYGITERHASLDGLLGLGLDAIVVAVPDAFHADVACQGLEAGLHVLCEKPLALSLEECDRIAAARDAAGRVAAGRHDEALRPGLPAPARAAARERRGRALPLGRGARSRPAARSSAHLPMTAASDLAPRARPGAAHAAWPRAFARPSGGDPPRRRRARVRGLPLLARARRQPAAGRARAPRRALVRAGRRRRLVGRGARRLALGGAARRRAGAPRAPQPAGRQRLHASASRCTAATACSS